MSAWATISSTLSIYLLMEPPKINMNKPAYVQDCFRGNASRFNNACYERIGLCICFQGAHAAYDFIHFGLRQRNFELSLTGAPYFKHLIREKLTLVPG